MLGVITQAGLDALNASGTHTFGAAGSSLVIKLPGWKRWEDDDARILWEDLSITGLPPEQ